MKDLEKIPSRAEEEEKGDWFHVVVETPRGATMKMKYEPRFGAFTVSRALSLGVAYPYDWGFVPSTEAEDGDPLDAMVLFDGSTFPGVVLTCRALGVVQLSQKKEDGKGRERNDRVIAVPKAYARYDEVRGPNDLPKRAREEIEQFFLSAVLFTDKKARIEGWGEAKDAIALLAKSERRWRAKKK